MKIETFDREDHQKKIVAEFDSDILERYKRQAARKIASEARIPGFRPGKAPFDMVRRLYGDQAIQEEAVNLILDKEYAAVIQEAGIEPYGPGKLEEILSIDPLKFVFTVPLAPVIDLGDYKSIRLDYEAPTLDEARVDETIQRLRRRTGTAVPVERAAQEGDLVAVKLSARLNDPAEGEEPNLIEENTYEMIAGKPEDHTDPEGNEWPFKGFVNVLVGLSAGDSKVISHTFGDDGSADDLAGKTAEFSVSVESVKELNLPELDDSFAHGFGPYETLDALRTDIRKQMSETAVNAYNRKYADDLVDQLVNGASVVYAPNLLEEETEHMLTHFEEDLARQNMDLETYLKTRDMTKEEFENAELKPAAERRVKRQLVLEEFAVKENIQIQAEEVQMVYDMAVNQAKNYKKSAGAANPGMNTKDMADSLARGTINEIFNQRLLNRLRAIATGTSDAPAADVVETETVETSAPAEEKDQPEQE